MNAMPLQTFRLDWALGDLIWLKMTLLIARELD